MADHTPNGERREMDRRVILLEERVNRLTADAESEKDTRARVNSDWYNQLKALDAAWDLRFEKLTDGWRTDMKAESAQRAADIDKHDEKQDAKSGKHDERIKILERNMYIAFGVLGTLQVLLTVILKWL